MRTALVVAGLMLSACVGQPTIMTAEDCKHANWADLGHADALLGRQPQIEAYRKRCAPAGVAPDEKEYLAGWKIGYSEWEQRVARSPFR
jgi:hypothetical protein